MAMKKKPSTSWDNDLASKGRIVRNNDDATTHVGGRLTQRAKDQKKRATEKQESKQKRMLNSQLGDLAGGRSTRYGVITKQEGIRGTGARSRVEQRRIDQTKRKKRGAK